MDTIKFQKFYFFYKNKILKFYKKTVFYTLFICEKVSKV